MNGELLPFCECGCGERITKKGNRFIWGHNMRGTTRIRSPKHCASMSDARKGIPHTPEHCAAITKGLQNSDAMKASAEARKDVPLTPEHIAAIKKGQEESGVYEAMRGGNDICDHHYIYDHSDLSLNTVQMTRSDHTSLHNILKKLGYIVPHINTKEI